MRKQFRQIPSLQINGNSRQAHHPPEFSLGLPYNKLISSLPRSVQRICIASLKRACDPQAEVTFTNYLYAEETEVAGWGWIPLLALMNALGLALVAYGFSYARYGGTYLQVFIYPGLLLIFTPTALRIISSVASRTERIWLLCFVGICCYLIKVITNPLNFSFPFDEFLHWRTADDIARSGHLFSTNPLLPVSPYYPGLEILTNALGTISGLDTFHAGIIVVGVARLLMILSLFALNEQILKSSRIASISTIIYMANPHFLLFDSQFAYESLALPLATFVMFAMAPHQWISARLGRLEPLTPFVAFAKTGCKVLSNDLRWMTLMAWITLVALVLTHHVTSFFLVGLLILWAVAYGFLRLTPVYRSNLAWTALIGTLLSISWIVLSGSPVVGYIFSFLGQALTELGHILLHTGSTRQLFVTYNGQSTSLLERAIILMSVIMILFSLPFGLLCLWQRYRLNALTTTLGIVSLFYPVSQVFRFTDSGAQLTDRAAAFLFIAISFVLAIFITQFWPIRCLNWKNSLLITCALSIIFLGGIILGVGPGLSVLPGPYAVGGDSRSIGPEGIQAALWTPLHLGFNNRIGTDRTNQTLMGTYGDQSVVTAVANNIDVSPLFFSSSLGTNELSLMRSGQIHYLVVDLRLAQALPLIGYYFVEGEPNGYHYTTPINSKSLTKFNTIPQINRVFDSGDIVIYDVEELINAPQKP